jgi:hypothetical protein
MIEIFIIFVVVFDWSRRIRAFVFFFSRIASPFIMVFFCKYCLQRVHYILVNILYL